VAKVQRWALLRSASEILASIPLAVRAWRMRGEDVVRRVGKGDSVALADTALNATDGASSDPARLSPT